MSSPVCIHYTMVLAIVLNNRYKGPSPRMLTSEIEAQDQLLRLPHHHPRYLSLD